MRCAIPAGLMPASGQNPKLPHRNSNGRFTSISGHNVAAVFLSDAWVMRQVPTSLGNRFPLALAVPQLSVCLLRLLTLRPNWVIISCLPRLDRLHSHSGTPAMWDASTRTATPCHIRGGCGRSPCTWMRSGSSLRVVAPRPWMRAKAQFLSNWIAMSVLCRPRAHGIFDN
jgi:hypothetical protein